MKSEKFILTDRARNIKCFLNKFATKSFNNYSIKIIRFFKCNEYRQFPNPIFKERYSCISFSSLPLELLHLAGLLCRAPHNIELVLYLCLNAFEKIRVIDNLLQNTDLRAFARARLTLDFSFQLPGSFSGHLNPCLKS